MKESQIVPSVTDLPPSPIYHRFTKPIYQPIYHPRFTTDLPRVGFQDASRFELVMKLAAGILVGGEVVAGEHDGLAGESVAEGVQGGSGFGFGLGGFG